MRIMLERIRLKLPRSSTIGAMDLDSSCIGLNAPITPNKPCSKKAKPSNVGCANHGVPYSSFSKDLAFSLRNNLPI